MASTYSTSLRIQLIGTGEQSGVWGSTTNANLGTIVEQAITGVQTISLSGSSYTLTSLNGISDQARNAAIIFTGTPSATCTVTTPAVNKIYIIFNNTSGGFGVTMTTGSGSTITIPNGSTYIIYCDGTNYYSASNYVSSNVSITGGTINGTTIGATTPSTGAFTTLSASSTLTASSNATVGGTLGVTGNTTLSGTLGVTGNATFSGTIAGTLASTVTGTTQSSSDNSTKIATTAYVTTAVTTATGSLGTMSTQNANAVAITGGTITNNVVTTLGEVTTVLATAATGTVNYDVLTQSVLYYTTNASGNWTLNIRGNSGTTLNSVMGVGETRTITFLVTQGSTAYYNNALTIDGNAVSPKWQGGAAPTLGDINSIDTYTYSIIKTASATFTVLASQSQFK